MTSEGEWSLPVGSGIAADAGHVAIVGAGIVNLMTAWRLTSAGYRTDVYDSGPGPVPDPEWASHGCTMAGDNARMFTLTEADVYHQEVAAPLNSGPSLLGIAVSDGGWRAFPERSWTSAERRWASDFQSVPGPLSERYESDVTAFNREAGRRWESCISHQPALFTASGLTRGILRLYTSTDTLRRGIGRHQRIRALRQVLSSAQIAVSHPALSAPCRAGIIAGGITVTGFTVAIHDLVRNLVELLSRSGVRFHWSHPVDGIRWAGPARSQAAGVRDWAGRAIEADHFVLSPGAYGHDLLVGTRAVGQIQGVLGVWITLPNVDPPLTCSVKLRRDKHITPDTNVTVVVDPGRGPLLILGAGYGWTGARPQNIDPAELEALFLGVQDTARRFFPAAYQVACSDGPGLSRRWCVRPWTATNLGIFEMAPTAAGGKLIVTGGHNTGGFAQAPAVAEAVLAALRGRSHRMHALYDPLRSGRDLRRMSADLPLGGA